MPAEVDRPWSLFFSKMRRSDEARVTYAEVTAARADAVTLVRDGLLAYGRPDGYEPPGCERGCTPNLDWASRKHEGLVGVACPHECGCWAGFRWVPSAEVDSLSCRSNDVFTAARARNGLLPLDARVHAPFVPVGLLPKRGLRLPVVWARTAFRGFEAACLGLRAELGFDGLVVLVARDPRIPFSPASSIAILELLDDLKGDLHLRRALDHIDPGYRDRAALDPMLDLDHVRLRLATVPGERHVVEINGHDVDGFRKSDVLFTQLLLLAAARLEGRRDGWRLKAALVGDFAARPSSAAMGKADRALEKLRAELASLDVPGLVPSEVEALLKAERGSGRVRLGVLPENIELDGSLAELEWVSPSTTVTKGGGRRKSTKSQEAGIEKAALLLREARRMGAPAADR